MNNIKNNLIAIVIFVLSLVIYWTTSYPSITWWDSSEYSDAAICLGLTVAPGSIILTLFGWVLSKFASHNPAFLFNLFAGLVASLTVSCVFWSFKTIRDITSKEKQKGFTLVENLSLIITSGIIICSATLWEYATMFTPYILTALFTVLILLAVLRWWINANNSDSWKGIFIVTLLLGIDFSVHRTNAVLLPGILAIMLIRNPKTFLNYKSYLSAISGIILGLSVQLLYIPMSLNDPLLNMGETNNLSRWWEFISLQQYGGGFLMDIFIRKGPLWTYQIPYYFKGFANNFFYFNHSTIILGFVPTLLGLAGIAYLFKTDRQFAIAFVTFFILTIAASIIQFNLPEDYFRPIYRHYLPTYVIFSIFILLGTCYIVRKNHRAKWISISIVLLLLLGASLIQYSTNFEYCNGSKRTFTIDHASNIINSIDKNGIVFNNGDNQYFPELYLQIGEKQRLDISHCNLSLLNLGWYIRQNQRHDKNFPFTGKGIDINNFNYKNWVTQFASISISDSTKLKYGSRMDTLHLSLRALRIHNLIFLQDAVLFDILKNNKWKRPIYLVKQGFDDVLYNWLKPYLRDEGLVLEFVPDSSLGFDATKVESNLGKFNLSGYNDYSVTLDDVSKNVGQQYYEMYLKVAGYKAETGNWKGALSYIKQMKEFLPFDRLQPEKQVIERTEQLDELIKTNLH